MKALSNVAATKLMEFPSTAYVFCFLPRLSPCLSLSRPLGSDSSTTLLDGCSPYVYVTGPTLSLSRRPFYLPISLSVCPALSPSLARPRRFKYRICNAPLRW